MPSPTLSHSPSPGHVLLTGGTGFIASHIILTLLRHNYTVTSTVRTPSKSQHLLSTLDPYTSRPNQLTTILIPSITSPASYAAALPTHLSHPTTPPVDFAIHTASPFHYDTSDPVANFLQPAVQGTEVFLDAVQRYCGASLKRVVLLSSFAAVRDPAREAAGGGGVVYDERDWNPVGWDEAVAEPSRAYQGSKTLGERRGWKWVREREKKGEVKWDLVCVNPSLVFGPVVKGMLGPDDLVGEVGRLNTSNQRIWDMVQGGMREGLTPTGFYSWVDVRDVAECMVRALEVDSEAVQGGETGEGRCLLIAGWFSNLEVARVVAGLEGGKYKSMLPEGLNRMEDDLPPLEKRYRWDDKRAREVYGVKYRDLEESVRDTVESLRAVVDGD